MRNCNYFDGLITDTIDNAEREGGEQVSAELDMKSWPAMRRRQDSICREFYFVEKCCSRGWTSLKVPGEGGINLVGGLRMINKLS